MNQVINKAVIEYYLNDEKPAIEFLRDAIVFLNGRDEFKNELQTIERLLQDFAESLH